MALSNIYREPRREITESAIGITVFVILMIVDYKFAVWFQVATGPKNGCPWPAGMAMGVFAGFLIIALAYFTHFLGETVCEWISDRGLEVRPRDRR